MSISSQPDESICRGSGAAVCLVFLAKPPELSEAVSSDSFYYFYYSCHSHL